MQGDSVRVVDLCMASNETRYLEFCDLAMRHAGFGGISFGYYSRVIYFLVLEIVLCFVYMTLRATVWVVGGREGRVCFNAYMLIRGVLGG